MQIEPVQRECPSCRFKRIPYARVVTKNRKHWIIYTCPMCKHKDIDEYKPRRIFDAISKKFKEEFIPDEDSEEQ